MAKNKGSIAIVGAGIGGMCSGVFLSRLGFDVTIYDQASRFGRVGAGIQQTPNAMKVHRQLGTEARLRQVAFQSPSGISREWDSGKPSSESKVGMMSPCCPNRRDTTAPPPTPGAAMNMKLRTFSS